MTLEGWPSPSRFILEDRCPSRLNNVLEDELRPGPVHLMFRRWTAARPITLEFQTCVARPALAHNVCLCLGLASNIRGWAAAMTINVQFRTCTARPGLAYHFGLSLGPAWPGTYNATRSTSHGHYLGRPDNFVSRCMDSTGQSMCRTFVVPYFTRSVKTLTA